MSSANWLQQFVPLLEALHCGAVVLSRSGRVVCANGRACDMLGRDAGQVVGSNIGAIYGDAQARETLGRELIDRFDQPHEAEFWVPRADGSKLAVITSARPLGGEPPLSDHRLVTLTDISELKTLQEHLREQYNIISELSNTVLEQAVGLKHYNKDLEERVRKRTSELHDANLDTIYMLAVASEAKDEDTGLHVRRIQSYVVLLATEMGLSKATAEEIGYSAILHDIGKIHIPDFILKKPGPLTDEERRACQQHTLYGERILSDKAFFAMARRIARSHHENWDGTGYPDQLAGDAIPPEARIVHLADVFDALTTPRVYKAAWSRFDAAGVVFESEGRMFDPRVVKAFRELFNTGRFELMTQNEVSCFARAPVV